MRTLVILVILFPYSLFGQQSLSGRIINPSGQPIMAAHVFWTANPQKGTFSLVDGSFKLPFLSDTTLADSILVSSLGYTEKKVAVDELMDTTIVLSPSEYVLQAILIEGHDPISESFLLTRQEKLDIYLNPIAAGDALRSLIALPASTNTSESANPELRGSSSDRSRVLMNGVPIFQPVRNTQINGIGNFSLFNTEMLESQYVYPTNPPLTRGNTTAGAVAIETTQNVQESQTKLSAGMAHAGLFHSQKMGNQSFFQAYTNHQFGRLFIDMNRRNLPELRAFRNWDAGLNIHLENEQGWSLDAFAYGIDESYQVGINLYGQDGDVISGRQRHFNIFRLRKKYRKGALSFHHGWDGSRTEFQFLSLNAQLRQRTWFTALDWRRRMSDQWEWQSGIVHETQYYHFQDQIDPFLFNPKAPEGQEEALDTLQQRRFETYRYIRFNPEGNWSFQAGLRASLNKVDDQRYWSGQASARWQIAPQQALLISGGWYNSFSIPTTADQNIRLLKSQQLTIDYDWVTAHEQHLHLAAFAKKESGPFNPEIFLTEDERHIMGLEGLFEQPLGKHFSTSISVTYLNQEVVALGYRWAGQQDNLFLLKALIQYRKPNLLDASLNYIWHNGHWEIPWAKGSPLETFPDFQEPQPERLGQYGSLNLSISRFFPWAENRSLVVYLNANNLLNRNNIRSIRYNEEMERNGWTYFQRRTVYAGMVLSF